MTIPRFNPLEKDVYNVACNAMLNNLNKLQQIAQHTNAPGIEGWFQWELVTSSHIPTNWNISKGVPADLELTDISSNTTIHIELKGITGSDFDDRVKKWYYNKQNNIIEKRKTIPILFLSRMHQVNKINKLRNDPDFICNYKKVGTEWVVGICKLVK